MIKKSMTGLLIVGFIAATLLFTSSCQKKVEVPPGPTEAELQAQREKEAADRFGLNFSAYNKRLSRIKKRLGFETISQVSKLMTLLAICSKRRNRRHLKLFSDYHPSQTK